MRKNLRSEQKFAALENGDLRFASCCDAPPPPNMQPVADAQAAASEYGYKAANEDLAFRKQVYEESKPRQQALYELATRVANQQMGIADENQGFAREQQDFYRKTYQPNEMQTMADAYGQQYLGDDDRAQLNDLVAGKGDLDAAGRMSALQGLGRKAEEGAASAAEARAAAGVNATFGQTMRGITRRGLDPNRLVAAAAQLNNQQVAVRAGAANQARESVRGQMMGLRTGVANFGRNMPNTAGQAFGLATQAGSSGVANQNAGYMSGLPYAQFQSGGYGTQLGAAGLGTQGALGMGGVMNNLYGIQMQGYGAEMGALGTAVGMGAGMYARGGK